MLPPIISCVWVGCYQILAFCTIRATDVDATRDHESCSAASRRMDMCWPNNTFSIATGLAFHLFHCFPPTSGKDVFRHGNESVALDAVKLYRRQHRLFSELEMLFRAPRCPNSVPRASSVLNNFCDIRNTLCQESLISRLATSCRVDGPRKFGRISGQPRIFLRALFAQV